MKVHETVENMSKALDSVQRGGSEVQGDVASASVLRGKSASKVGA